MTALRAARRSARRSEIRISGGEAPLPRGRGSERLRSRIRKNAFPFDNCDIAAAGRLAGAANLGTRFLPFSSTLRCGGKCWSDRALALAGTARLLHRLLREKRLQSGQKLRGSPAAPGFIGVHPWPTMFASTRRRAHPHSTRSEISTQQPEPAAHSLAQTMRGYCCAVLKS